MRAQERSSFVDLQRRHSEHADAAHFAWQTRAPYFADTEAALLDDLPIVAGDRLLELGCGEGGNLYHLARLGCVRFGIDFSPAKAAFAHAHTGAHLATADAARLPFSNCSFDVVLIRDLLHHLPDRREALAEARRILRPGGRLLVIEPNIRSPLAVLQWALVPAERGLHQSTAEGIVAGLTDVGFAIEATSVRQPLPLARLVLHPRFGSPALGRFQPVARLLGSLDAAWERLVPRRAWLYLIFRARRREDEP